MKTKKAAFSSKIEGILKTPAPGSEQTSVNGFCPILVVLYSWRWMAFPFTHGILSLHTSANIMYSPWVMSDMWGLRLTPFELSPLFWFGARDPCLEPRGRGLHNLRRQGRAVRCGGRARGFKRHICINHLLRLSLGVTCRWSLCAMPIRGGITAPSRSQLDGVAAPSS